MSDADRHPQPQSQPQPQQQPQQQPHPLQLPEVFEASWCREQVDALFHDLQQGAAVSKVQVRTATSNSRPEEVTTVTLEQAREMLADGQARAMQIYYEFDGQTWCDTLLLTPDAIRIVRYNVPPNA